MRLRRSRISVFRCDGGGRAARYAPKRATSRELKPKMKNDHVDSNSSCGELCRSRACALGQRGAMCSSLELSPTTNVCLITLTVGIVEAGQLDAPRAGTVLHTCIVPTIPDTVANPSEGEDCAVL
jgi:hypothetical protein